LLGSRVHWVVSTTAAIHRVVGRVVAGSGRLWPVLGGGVANVTSVGRVWSRRARARRDGRADGGLRGRSPAGGQPMDADERRRVARRRAGQGPLWRGRRGVD